MTVFADAPVAVDALYRQTVVEYLPEVDPRRVDGALLHWRLSLDFNSPLFLATPTRAVVAALVLRQAKVNPTGALLLRSALCHRLDRDGRMDWVLHTRPPAAAFADPTAVPALLDTATAAAEHGAEESDGLWSLVDAEHGVGDDGAMTLALLPGCSLWHRQLGDRCRQTARRIARETRRVLLGDPLWRDN
ncbi:MAG: hypothetical protein HQL40_01455 [Alphaproteobacteria bacterium]|nr:hypothetical protein [Alphaproteobacteria bacterium]